MFYIVLYSLVGNHFSDVQTIGVIRQPADCETRFTLLFSFISCPCLLFKAMFYRRIIAWTHESFGIPIVLPPFF